MLDHEIDEILLSNITRKWRKMAFVIGATMGQIDVSDRAGRNDLYFANRIAFLVSEKLIDHRGNLNQMRECEIRLSGE